MGSSGLSRMIAVDSFQVSIGRPSTDTMRSPGSMPAAAPGAAGSPGSQVCRSLVAGSAQAETDPTVVEACATPKPISSTPNSSTASTRFMNGPPNMMMMRFHTASR